MPMNTATITVEDYDGEKSRSSFNIGPLTAANFTAKRAAIDTLVDAAAAIIVGQIRQVTISEQFAESTSEVAQQMAQRETKWLVTYRDNTQFLDVANTINNVGYGNLYSIEIPAADLDLLDDHEDNLPLVGITEVEDFVTAFEAVQNSPTGGNEVVVVSIRHVGRSL
jgi:hypothetical protein